MIKILIITDNVEQWVQKLTGQLSHYKCDKNRDSIMIRCDLFSFEVRKSFPMNMRGSCYSCAVLDKGIDPRIEYETLMPTVKASIIKTRNYWMAIK